MWWFQRLLFLVFLFPSLSYAQDSAKFTNSTFDNPFITGGFSADTVSASSILSSLGLNPEFASELPSQRGIGLAGVTTIPGNVTLTHGATTLVYTFNQPVGQPLGANGIGNLPTWAFRVDFTAAIAVPANWPNTQCALELAVTDTTRSLGNPTPEVDIPLTRYDAGLVITKQITYSADNIPQGDGLTFKVYFYNGNPTTDLTMRRLGIAPGVTGGGGASYISVLMVNN